jgi:hypothetical protein
MDSSNTDSQIEHYWLLRPTQFSRLGRIELVQRFGDDMGQDLALELRSGDPTTTRRLVMTFSSIGELLFSPGSWSVIPVYLEITSIRDRHWENANYRVSDSEHIDFSFYCQEFTAELIDSE